MMGVVCRFLFARSKTFFLKILDFRGTLITAYQPALSSLEVSCIYLLQKYYLLPFLHSVSSTISVTKLVGTNTARSIVIDLFYPQNTVGPFVRQ